MRPGRDLDVMIVELVFHAKVKFLNQKAGWRIDYVAEDNKFNEPIIAMDMVDGYRLKHYSTNLKDALELAERLPGVLTVTGNLRQPGDEQHAWEAWFSPLEEGWAVGESMAHAVCLSILNTTILFDKTAKLGQQYSKYETVPEEE